MLDKLFKIADSTLVNLVSRLGTQRDKASYDRFAWFERKSIAELKNLYYTDSTARKIINKPTGDMFRNGYYFTGIASKDLEKLKNKLKRLHIDEHLRQAVCWSRLYGKGFILLASADNLPLSMPFNSNRRLSFITALSPEHLSPTSEKLHASQTGGFFNRPAFYRLHGQDVDNLTNGQLIHYSRVIEISWEDGNAVLQTVYDELLRYASINNNVASLIHETKVDVIKTPDLAEQISSNSDNVIKRFSLVSLMKSNNGTLLLDAEEDYQSKHYNFSGLPELMREFAIQTACASDIPYTILFGQSPAGLNSTGEHDLRNYYDTIASYQQWQLRPAFEQLLSIIGKYLLPSKSFELVFNPLWQLDEKTRSEVEKNNSERDIRYLENGIITEAQIAKQLAEEGTYTVIDDKHIKLLEGLADVEQNTIGFMDSNEA